MTTTNESSKPFDGGPAFSAPTGARQTGRYEFEIDHFNGMTLRDYFAIRAPEPTAERMQIERLHDKNRNPYNEGHKPRLRTDIEIRCDLAYEYADA
ncbi:hypothetical protein, partial [Burkholderia gladioli]